MGEIESIKFEKSICDCFVETKEGKRIFRKIFPNELMGFMVGVEYYFFKSIIHNFPTHKHLEVSGAFHKNLEKELLTWNLWKENNIPTLDLVGFENNQIEWVYLEGSSSLIESLNKEVSYLKFDSFLETYSSIRALAKNKSDTDYLHSDPHLGNFLVSSNGLTIPIDSAVLLRKDLSFGEIDKSLLSQSLSSIVNLNTPERVKKNYIRMFKKILNDDEINFFINNSVKMHKLPRYYSRLRDVVINKIKKTNKVKRNSVLEQDNFEKAYGDYIRDIFLE